MGYDEVPWTLTRSGAAGTDVVTLAEVKEWLRVEYSTEDALLSSLIPQATSIVEENLNRSLRTTTWVLGFPAGVGSKFSIELPRPPYASLTSIEEYDEESDAWVAEDLDDYNVRVEEPHAVVSPKYGESWPTGPVRITYTAGHTDDSDTPRDEKNAVLTMLAWEYMHRGDEPLAPGVSGTTGTRPSPRQIYPHLWNPGIA